MTLAEKLGPLLQVLLLAVLHPPQDGV
jgi:hypothetical protein